MSEAYVPEPAPEPLGYWQEEPARCIECGSIIDIRRGPDWDDGDPDGWCSHCETMVVAVFPDSQPTENGEEER